MFCAINVEIDKFHKRMLHLRATISVSSSTVLNSVREPRTHVVLVLPKPVTSDNLPLMWRQVSYELSDASESVSSCVLTKIGFVSS